METLQQITQEIISQVEGGSFTDETKFEEEFVDAIVHQVRADLFRQNINSVQSNLWVQRYTPTYSEYINEDGDCFVKFRLCAPILDGNGGDITVYVGPENGKVGYTRIGLYGSESVDFAHPLTNPYKKGLPSYKWEYFEDWGSVGIKVYGNTDVRNIRVDFIHANPTQNPKFRRATDAYPISEELIVPLKTGVMNRLMAQMAQVPADNLSNSEDLQNQQPTQIKTK